MDFTSFFQTPTTVFICTSKVDDQQGYQYSLFMGYPDRRWFGMTQYHVYETQREISRTYTHRKVYSYMEYEKRELSNTRCLAEFLSLVSLDRLAVVNNPEAMETVLANQPVPKVDDPNRSLNWTRNALVSLLDLGILKQINALALRDHTQLWEMTLHHAINFTNAVVLDDRHAYGASALARHRGSYDGTLLPCKRIIDEKRLRPRPLPLEGVDSSVNDNIFARRRTIKEIVKSYRKRVMKKVETWG